MNVNCGEKCACDSSEKRRFFLSEKKRKKNYVYTWIGRKDALKGEHSFNANGFLFQDNISLGSFEHIAWQYYLNIKIIIRKKGTKNKR